MTRDYTRRITLAAAVAASATGCARQPITPAPAGEPAPPAITDGRSLIAAMRDRFGGQWYTTLSVRQNNTLYAGRTETKLVWQERIVVPGKLRIDYHPLSEKSGVLFDGSMVHVFDNGKAIDSRPGINAVVLATADVYVLPAERSAHLLDSLGFDLAKLRRDTWDGAPVWVVGAEPGDTTSSQLWVDTERLITLRVVQKERRGARDLVNDVRLGKHADVGGFPIATEVLQYRDGRLVIREEHTDMRVNEPIPDAAFDASKWTSTQPR